MKNQYKINKNKVVSQKGKNLQFNSYNKIQHLLKGLKISIP